MKTILTTLSIVLAAGPALAGQPSKARQAGAAAARGQFVDNDDCVTAALIACNNTAVIDNQWALTAPADPPFGCRIAEAGRGVGTVWYKFVAEDTSARITTCNSADPVDDTLLAVYSVNPADPCHTLTEIACDDDTCGLLGGLSRICIDALTPGQTYYIQAASDHEVAQGRITLDLVCPCPPPPTSACCFADGSCEELTFDQCVASDGAYVGDGTTCQACSDRPANDACADAQTLEIPMLSAAIGDVFLAVTDPLPMIQCYPMEQPVRNIWYKLTGNGNLLTLSTCNPGTLIDTMISVYCGGCDDFLCVAGSNDNEECGYVNGRTSLVSWCSAPGVRYYIAVGSFGEFNSSGSFELTLTEEQPLTCPAIVDCGDCNDNDTVDHIDIGLGVSQDCNDNGVPDECENLPPGLAWAHSVATHKVAPPGTTQVLYVDLDIANIPGVRTSEPRNSGIRILEFQFERDVESADLAISGPEGLPVGGGPLALAPGAFGPVSLGRIDLGTPLDNESIYSLEVTASGGPGCEAVHEFCINALTGDFDNNGIVDMTDRGSMTGFLLQNVEQATARYDVQVNGTDSGLIDFGDLATFMGFLYTDVDDVTGPACPTR